jgi:hypothetical protein
MLGYAELLVPPFDILEINGESERHDEIHATAPRRPTVAVRIVSKLPEGEEDKKDHRARNQDFVSRDEFHDRWI